MTTPSPTSTSSLISMSAPIEAKILIDFGASKTDIKSMSGILHGISAASSPSDAMILPLATKFWRTGILDLYTRVVGFGAEFQLVLSDTWGYGGSMGWPYDNYAAWENHVQTLAQQNKDKQIMWDIWNEPDQPYFWAGTRDQLFETYKRAYTVLRNELGPNVMIGGPSLSHYDKEFISAFLNYCQSNNLEVNFLSWHELNDYIISSIPDRLTDARTSFMQNSAYASINMQRIYINEMVGENSQYSPGELIGYLYNLESSMVDGAAKSCWDSATNGSNCFNNSLDGMVTPDTSQPRADWWVYKAYAEGFSSRIQSQSDNPLLAALASATNSNGNAQVLMGYFDQQPDAPTIPVSVSLTNLQQLGFNDGDYAHIELTKLTNNGEQILQQPLSVKQKDVLVRKGAARFPFSNCVPHEGYILTITKKQ